MHVANGNRTTANADAYATEKYRAEPARRRRRRCPVGGGCVL